MAIKLAWTAAADAACFYDVAQLVAGREPVQAGSLDAVAPAAHELGRFLTAHAWTHEAFFGRLVPEAIANDGDRALAETVLTKLVGRAAAQPHANALAGWLGDCRRAHFAAFPQLVAELELRARPLRELWEAAGPGLLAGVARRTDRRAVVDAATIALVRPFYGGGGSSHVLYNSVTIEAVLTNSEARLPETVRLAWLLASLNADLPDLVERLSPLHAPAVVQWAMIPAVIDAAVDVEMLRPASAGDDDALLALAGATWNLPQLAGPQTPGIVADWWRFTQSSGAAWPVALAGLERLLLETSGR